MKDGLTVRTELPICVVLNELFAERVDSNPG